MDTHKSNSKKWMIDNYPIKRLSAGEEHSVCDVLAREEPLEVRITAEESPGVAWSVTMRTPGNDEDLVLGLLWTEGVVRSLAEVLSIKPCGKATDAGFTNTWLVTLRKDAFERAMKVERSTAMNASCGFCGRKSIDVLTKHDQMKPSDTRVEWERLQKALHDFEAHESLFRKTGGAHACAYWEESVLFFADDIGRHNALDKLIGQSLLTSCSDLHRGILVLSGRVSYEMVEKAASRNAQCILAIGAPTTLAIDTARYYNINLFGFGKSQSINSYYEAFLL